MTKNSENWMRKNCPTVLDYSNIGILGLTEIDYNLKANKKTDIARLFLFLENLITGKLVISKELIELMMSHINIQPIYEEVCKQIIGKEEEVELITENEALNQLNCKSLDELLDKYGDIISPIKVHNSTDCLFIKQNIEFIKFLEN